MRGVVTVFCTFPDLDPATGGFSIELNPDVPPWSERRPCNDGTCEKYGCIANRNDPKKRANWERECAAREVMEWEERNSSPPNQGRNAPNPNQSVTHKRQPIVTADPAKDRMHLREARSTSGDASNQAVGCVR